MSDMQAIWSPDKGWHEIPTDEAPRLTLLPSGAIRWEFPEPKEDDDHDRD